MLNKYFKLHHFGLALKNFDISKKFYRSLGYKISREYLDHSQGVKIVLCTSKNKPTIELVSSLRNSSPIKSYLKRFDEVIYHTCYEFNNKEALNILQKKFNAKCILSPRPAKIFKNKKISFYYIKNLGLIELLDNAK